MGFEQRGNATYYYTAERVAGRVVKSYVGPGPAAELAVEFDALKRAERAELAALDQQERDELAALDALLAPLNELADAATVAALVAAGCHRPKRGPWRKRCV